MSGYHTYTQKNTHELIMRESFVLGITKTSLEDVELDLELYPMLGKDMVKIFFLSLTQSLCKRKIVKFIFYPP